MSQEKSQTKSVETANVEAVNTVSDEATSVTVADHCAKAVEATSTARPKQAVKGKGESWSGSRDAKSAKKTARATGAAASKDQSGAEADPATAAALSKLDRLVALLRTPGGATLPELQAATGWQVHSVRGAMAGALRKKGYSVTSEKSEGGLRRYRIAEAS
jgi:hypothetical protein